MKMQLLPFDKAYRVAKTFESDVCGERSIYGLSDDAIPWGKLVDVDFRKSDTYRVDNFFVPEYCFEERCEEIMENLLRYGDFLKIDFHYELDATTIRPVIVRLISYKGDIFYYKMFDDTKEVIECEKVDVVG